MKHVKFLGNYGLFFIVIGLAVALSILIFDYSIAVEIKNHFQSSADRYPVPIWVGIISAICINFTGILLAIIFIKGLKDMAKTNKHQAQHQNLSQY